MNRLTPVWLVVLLACLLIGCTNGALLVERSREGYTTPPVKVVSIKPEYYWLTRKKKEDVVLRSEKRLEGFEQRLERSARRAGVDLDIYTPSNLSATDFGYFNDLLPLRRYILRVNNLQETGARKDTRGGGLNARTQTFAIDPEIPPDYSWLATKYGTPYFAVQGVITTTVKRPNMLAWIYLLPPLAALYFVPKHESLYYQVVVDVVSSRVVYREVRTVNRPLNGHNLDVMLYDSFRILQNR